MRTALDLLAWQLVLANGGTPTQKTCFPIADTEGKFRQLLGAALNGASKRALATVGQIRAFQGGNDALWLLYKLDIVDKHRLLFTVGCAYTELSLDFAESLPPLPGVSEQSREGGPVSPSGVGPHAAGVRHVSPSEGRHDWPFTSRHVSPYADTAEAWASVARRGDRFAALEPIYDAVRDRLGELAANVARGVSCRHDWGPQYTSSHFTGSLAWLGIFDSPAYVGEPPCNGCAERFIRTLKEQCIWSRAVAQRR